MCAFQSHEQTRQAMGACCVEVYSEYEPALVVEIEHLSKSPRAHEKTMVIHYMDHCDNSRANANS